MNRVQEILANAQRSNRSTLSEHESKQILAEYGIPIVEERLVEDLEGAEGAANDLGYPVVLKVCSDRISHKTEKGFVVLDLHDRNELAGACELMARKMDEASGRFLVQKMVEGAREVVAGFVRDHTFGPCVMFGLGGILTEIMDDVSFRIAPLAKNDALEMMSDIKGRRILSAVRGQPEIHRETMGRILVALGQIGIDYPMIKEIDVNPLIIRDAFPVAVDALVVLDQGQIGKEEGSDQRPGGLSPNVVHNLFSPRSVVVIGASEKPHKPGNDVVLNILANDFPGRLFLVNPRGGRIGDHEFYTSIDQLPDGLDLAIIILPAKLNTQAIRECAAKGIKTAVLSAGGFSEVDEDGATLQSELVKVASETGIRLLGPNTSGHISMPENFTSSFFPLGRIPKGSVSYIAQTGNFATHTMRYIISGEHFGVARVVGLGNKIDIDESDILEFYANDAHTKSIIVYLESLKRPGRFLEIARQVTPYKPIIFLKGGRTSRGAAAAVAHTAALASDDKIIDGALKQAGIVRIDKYSHLFLAAKGLTAMPLPKGNRISFLAPSGAMLVTLTDLCQHQLGLDVSEVEERTRLRLQEISPPYIRMRNPVDIWPAAAANGVEFAYREGMAAVLADPNIDAVVPILMLTKETGVPPLDFIVDLAKRFADKPIYVTFSGDKKHMDAAKGFLEPKGIPTFPLIEEPFEVLSILARCRSAMVRKEL